MREKWDLKMDKEELKLYVPDVYQKKISDIDYVRLWENGVRVISFDIDRTLSGMVSGKINAKVRKEIKLPKVRALVSKLHGIGFKAAIISNTKQSQVEKTAVL